MKIVEDKTFTRSFVVPAAQYVWFNLSLPRTFYNCSNKAGRPTHTHTTSYTVSGRSIGHTFVDDVIIRHSSLMMSSTRAWSFCWFYMNGSVCQYVCHSVRLYVCPSVCPSVCLSLISMTMLVDLGVKYKILSLSSLLPPSKQNCMICAWYSDQLIFILKLRGYMYYVNQEQVLSGFTNWHNLGMKFRSTCIYMSKNHFHSCFSHGYTYVFVLHY